MSDEEHDDLWQLLGKARQPTASPFFSRNVLREVRGLRQERPSAFAWLRRYWQVPAAVACSIALGLLLTSPKGQLVQQQPAPEPDRVLVMAERVSESPDYLVISHLDELLASEESSLWLESNVY